MHDQGNSDHDKHGVRVPVDSARNEHLCELSAWFDSTCINTSSLVDAFPPVVVFFSGHPRFLEMEINSVIRGENKTTFALLFFFWRALLSKAYPYTTPVSSGIYLWDFEQVDQKFQKV